MTRAFAAHGFFALMVPAWVAVGLALGGAWTYAAVLWAFVVVALVDQITPLRHTPEADPHARPVANPIMALLTWVILPIQAVLTLWYLAVASADDLAWWEVLGLVLSMGTAAGGIGITVAHELIHRARAVERGLGIGLLALTSYAHFRIEHVHGHHRHVGTAQDPATARHGESLYAFLPRVVVQSWLSAWRIETARLGRRGLAAWGPRNRMLHYVALQGALYLGVWAAFGWAGVGLFLAQGMVAVILLEAVDYIEHYGLVRAETAAGTPERVTEHHSWNSDHRLTNWTTFNLGLHADHHRAPGLPYHQLHDHEAAPKMPTGYSGMILLAFLPPLWFRVMNPRVAAWRHRRDLDATAEHDTVSTAPG